jgi:hypothetical protein
VPNLLVQKIKAAPHSAESKCGAGSGFLAARLSRSRSPRRGRRCFRRFAQTLDVGVRSPGSGAEGKAGITSQGNERGGRIRKLGQVSLGFSVIAAPVRTAAV